ncbi:MAG: prepilin-type N-terminal cleavage/methylation domain-containing protein [Elusimicrobiaceae bacterium]|nr:prepilin-type N-terminal cleavage/methylation domain-containing protein [Elusimicrobiaceae bacterium]
MNILNKKSGYTLTEILIVVIIIGILASAGIPYYKDHIERQKAASGMTTLKIIGDSVDRYMALHGDTLPNHFDFTKLDIKLDTSALSNNNRSYTDGGFVFTLDITNNKIDAERGSGVPNRPLYTISYSLGDENDITCSSTTEICSETLHLT